jgi:HEAT repeat protein
VGFFNWLFGHQRSASPKRPRPKAVYGLEDGSPQIIVDTGKVQIVMDRAQFNTLYGGSWTPEVNKAPPAETAVPELVEVVKTGNNKEQSIAAIEALASMGPQAKGATFLLGLLTDPDGQIPWRALEVLAHRPEWMPQVLHVLTAALKDQSNKIRSRAVTMLMRLGSEVIFPALPALREASQDQNPHVQAHAREAVQLIESSVSKKP